ncbi:hypothetical protein ACJRO7_007806 [Eucalyptus globulus]|uniref:GDSL esterase/lipase n=1 Tax=Eucalyptus globulus TaxID=34317 RepID=A0ABD3IPF6_EUCGL
MAAQKLLLSFLFFSLLAGHKAVQGSADHHRQQLQRDAHSSARPEGPLYPLKPTRLFVFGDSYVDTGNKDKAKAEARSWKVPYGMTFPGCPSGRFSDGLILTDFLAKFFRVAPPLPMAWWSRAYGPHLRMGANFAYGGTGVFDTSSSDPNMTVQIDRFENLVRDAIFKVAVTQTSVALLANSGNDYYTYLAKHGVSFGLLDFIDKVVNQLVVNMKRVHSLGVRKVAVTSLPALGCVPQITSGTSYQSCNDTVNALVMLHNLNLQVAVDKLNNETSPFTFIMIDLYKPFKWVIENTTTFKNPFKPCCMGVSSEYLCGNVDADGTKKYTVCEDPSTHFFWDTVHPTQAGWGAVYWNLLPSLIHNFTSLP